MTSLVPSWMRTLRLVALLVAVVLMVVTILMIGGRSKQRASEEVERRLLATAISQRQTLDDYFDRARSVILLTSRNPAFAGLYHGPAERRDKRLAEVNAALGYLEHLYPAAIGEACLIDATGTEAARVVRGEIAPEDDLSTEEEAADFFAPTFAADHGEVYQARPYESPDTGEWVISNSTLVPSGGERARAIVHFEVTIESFRRAAAKQDSSYVTRVVDVNTGRVVLDSRRPQPLKAPLGQPAGRGLLRAALEVSGGSDGPVLTTAEGRPAAVAALTDAKGNANEWVVVVSPPEKATSSGLQLDPTAAVLLLAAIASAAVALLSFRASATALTHAALTDRLTGLPNRALVRDRLQRAILRSRRGTGHVAVMLLDLDRFKEINDTLGHHQGDVLLQRLATRLQEVARAADTVARLGGDEFAVVVEDIGDPAMVIGLAERIEAAINLPVMLDDVEVQVGVSIGIALHPLHAEDVDELFQRADVAMYAAKRLRQGWMLYDSSQDPYTAERLALVTDLRRAIKERTLSLHFQPKFDLQSLEISGVEALIRWEHPEQGCLAPDDFIPLAEHTGLINPLTELVIDEALGQVAEWSRHGYQIPVAVNLSARSLLDADLTATVAAALDRHGLEAGMLSLEITETVIMEDPERALAVLERLRSMGIRLAIDDFGTGYSSLAYLKRLPVSELKIDKSFVMNMGSNKDDAVIVRSTIDLGRNLGLDVVAEGVEDADALRELTDLSCSSAQGYHLARPLTGAAVTTLLSEVAAPAPQAGV